MSSREFIAHLRQLDVCLRLTDGRLACSAPSGVLQGELLSEISKRKPALLEFLRSAQQTAQPPPGGIPVCPRGELLPASSGQLRFWLLQQLEQQSHYNCFVTVRLQGPLDAGAMEHAVKGVVARHEPLRTTFEYNHGQLWQRLGPPCPAAWSLRTTGDTWREHVQEEISRPFDLERGPLMRVCLLRVSQHEHILHLTIHHIVFDGWSIGILLTELAELYTSRLCHRPATLKPLRIQYADYVCWQCEQLRGPRYQELVKYWQARLEGAPAIHSLPLDRPRPAEQDFLGGREFVYLPAVLVTGLTALAREESATPFMVLLAAFHLLLGRLSGEDDVVVGTPVSSRPGLETEQLIGFFLNTLVLRADLRGSPTFRELVRQVRDSALDAYAHQDLPFEALVDELQPLRTQAHPPLFQILFVMQNYPRRVMSMPELRANPLDLNASTAKFDLSLYLFEPSPALWLEGGPKVKEQGGLMAMLEFATALFERPTATRMLRHYQELLARVVEAPDRGIDECDLWLPEEVQAPAALAAPTGSLYELFAAQARRSPHRPALLWAEGSWTYAELHGHAERLAGFLAARGLGREDRVVVHMPRGPETVAAILGVLRAGAAFVPLPAAHPPDRTAFILEDSEARLCLTPPSVAEALSWTGPEAPLQEVGPGALAYLLYTSGSTGQPKGVLAEHGATVNRLAWMWERFPFGPDEVMCQKTSVGFVDSLWELFGGLLQGVPTLIPPDEVCADPARLLEALARGRVTRLTLVPSLLRVILERAPDLGARLPHLRQCVVSGEALTGELARRFRQAAPGCALLNLYGCTEAAGDSTCCEVPAELPEDGLVSLGTPIANTQVLLLDTKGSPVPPGVIGEIHLAGAGLARGYWRRPELEKASFRVLGSGQRAYRTGDFGRLRNDGQLEYHGRRDQQVKIRGARVELEEVEAVLLKHPLVRAGLVVGTADGLLAVAELRSPEPELVKAYLKRRLPGHMVPERVVAVAQLPLTSTGKLDRRAALQLAESPVPAEVEELCTPSQDTVRRIWAELFRRPRVGLHEDFFDLGGNSLRLVTLQTRLSQAFQRDLPLLSLFRHTTVAGQARWLDQEGSRLPGFDGEIRARSGPALLSSSQERLWVLNQLEPPEVYNIPLAFRLRGNLSIGALEQALQEILQRHEVLRTSIRSEGGVARPRLEPVPTRLLELVDLPAADLEDRLRAEARRPFDLSRAPLLRACLFQLAEDDHALLLVAHHIAFDGTSIGLLLEELSQLYASFRDGRSPPLPPLAIQYSDYAAWQLERLAGPILQAQLAYWLQRLRGAPARLELPTDRPRPAVQSFSGARQVLSLPSELSTRLAELVRAEDLSLFMLMLSAWQILLSRYSGQPRVVVGSPIAQRSPAATEALLGLFVNMVALDADFSANPRLRDILRATRESWLQAFENSQLPFSALINHLRPPRSQGHPPVFQVMLAMTPSGSGLTMPELEAQFLEPFSETAKFDLSLYVFEGKGLRLQEAEGRWSSPGSSGPGLLLEYNTDLFDHSTARRMLEHLQLVLELMAAAPETRVEEFPLLTAAERRDLEEWNATARHWRGPQRVHELFERQVRQTPSALAASWREERLTYAELNARANRLARRLLTLGAGRGRLVALHLRRSLDMLVALLAVLKAGAAYLPLSEEYPPERLSSILEQAAPGLTLIHSDLRQTLPADCQVLALDGPGPDDDSGDLELPGDASDLAYVIFTSGSTGRPKGVEIEHRSVVNFLHSMADQPGLAASDVLVAVTPLTFDIAVLELLLPLTVGGTTVIAEPTAALDATELQDLLRRSRASVLQATPITWRLLLEAGWPGDPNLRAFIGGEGYSVHLADAVAERVREVWNMYGPTEATIWCAVNQLSPGLPCVPLGRPVANTTFQVLDDANQPAGRGRPGRLYVGGQALARGYLGQPELTREKFGAGRLYETGDRVRYRTDGTLEFLGRTDHQVKLRGFRIELGEIEVTLRLHPAVDECAVTLATDAAGEAILRAFVQPSRAPADELREFVRSRLPAYMVPSSFVGLEVWPLSPNGKVDRSALAALAGAPLQAAERTYVGPGSELEASIAAVWQELLQVDRVSMRDNFFDLGGHSLLLVQAHARIERLLQRSLPLVDLFEYPTVSTLAQHLLGTRRPPASAPGGDRPEPALLGQRRARLRSS